MATLELVVATALLGYVCLWKQDTRYPKKSVVKTLLSILDTVKTEWLNV